MTLLPPITEARALVAGLGDTADAVADTLRAAGVRGSHASAFCCPVVRYLVARLRWPVLVTRDGGVLGYRIAFPVPAAVTDFLAGFAAGGYPDLMEAAA